MTPKTTLHDPAKICQLELLRFADSVRFNLSLQFEQDARTIVDAMRRLLPAYEEWVASLPDSKRNEFGVGDHKVPSPGRYKLYRDDAGDWEALYFDGRLVAEGHKVPLQDVGIDCCYLPELEDDGEFLEHFGGGSFPQSVSEIDKMIKKCIKPRELSAQFLGLPYRHQVAIARALGIEYEKILNLSDQGMALKVFTIAAHQNKLADLWDEVQRRAEPSVARENPFASKKATAEATDQTRPPGMPPKEVAHGVLMAKSAQVKSGEE